MQVMGALQAFMAETTSVLVATVGGDYAACYAHAMRLVEEAVVSRLLALASCNPPLFFGLFCFHHESQTVVVAPREHWDKLIK